MTQERFNMFIREYLKKNSKEVLPTTVIIIKPFLVTKPKLNILGLYYKEEDKNNYFVSTSSSTNAFEECIEAVIKEESLTQEAANSSTFSFVTYAGIDLESFYTKKKVLAAYNLTIIIPKVGKNGKVAIVDFAKSDKFKNNKILLNSEFLYGDMQECAEQFKLVKMLTNTLQTKWEQKDSISTLKQVCKGLNISEQTMFSWKKKNPQMFKAMLDGYFFSKIENILEFLVEVPNIQKNTWACDEVSLVDEVAAEGE